MKTTTITGELSIEDVLGEQGSVLPQRSLMSMRRRNINNTQQFNFGHGKNINSTSQTNFGYGKNINNTVQVNFGDGTNINNTSQTNF